MKDLCSSRYKKHVEVTYISQWPISPKPGAEPVPSPPPQLIGVREAAAGAAGECPLPPIIKGLLSFFQVFSK